MASGQLEQVIGRLAADAGFRHALRHDLNRALAIGGYALTDGEKAALVEADAPEIAVDRRVTKAGGDGWCEDWGCGTN
jgi:hypothetical protein